MFPRANTSLTLRSPELKQHFTASPVCRQNTSSLQHVLCLEQRERAVKLLKVSFHYKRNYKQPTECSALTAQKQSTFCLGYTTMTCDMCLLHSSFHKPKYHHACPDHTSFCTYFFQPLCAQHLKSTLTDLTACLLLLCVTCHEVKCSPQSHFSQAHVTTRSQFFRFLVGWAAAAIFSHLSAVWSAI